MSCPRSSSLRVVSAMSSCNVLPVTMEISPTKAGSCARQKSCNVLRSLRSTFTRCLLGVNWLSIRSLSLLRARLLLFPVARMSTTPLLHAEHLFLTTEVVSPQTAVPPAALTGYLAGLATSRSRTVILVTFVTVIGTEELPATTAFASARFATHRVPSPAESGRKSNSKNACEEDPRRRRKKSFQGE